MIRVEEEWGREGRTMTAANMMKMCLARAVGFIPAGDRADTGPGWAAYPGLQAMFPQEKAYNSGLAGVAGLDPQPLFFMWDRRKSRGPVANDIPEIKAICDNPHVKIRQKIQGSLIIVYAVAEWYTLSFASHEDFDAVVDQMTHLVFGNKVSEGTPHKLQTADGLVYPYREESLMLILRNKADYETAKRLKVKLPRHAGS
jgi:hypothetical protein